ncbi:MAG: hypothetical protein ACR2GU_14325 [Rubrobacteraceae bacterium]
MPTEPNNLEDLELMSKEELLKLGSIVDTLLVEKELENHRSTPARVALFDVPLITTGEEDLYATLAPSPEVTERQLREILYDHLVLKRVEDVDYESFSEEAIERLREYSEVHREQTLGVGRIDPLTGMWNPLPSALATSSR